MSILVLNCGSSSVKYQLFKIRVEDVLARGIVASIGSPDARITHGQLGKEKIHAKADVPDHARAINIILEKLTDPHDGILKDKTEIQVVGHRVVHGGERFSGSVVINEQTKKAIRDCFELAPLHNPHNMEGILACEKLLPNVLQVAVFDTAFHQTIPAQAYTYGIPYELAEKYHIRTYGFHGTSHYYVSEKAAQLLNMPYTKAKIVTCHLGNGCSIAAVNGGRCVDTSMGFTPLEGLLMGTRCGDIDPAIPLFLMHNEKMTMGQVEHLLNDNSGLLGISGITNDMRLLLQKAASGSEKAQRAIDVFCYRVKKYIAAYVGVLGGADALVFTAGIGENAPLIRKKCCETLDALGISIDEQHNKQVSDLPLCISSESSRVKIFSIPTKEEMVIAREAKFFLDKITYNRI